MIVVAPIAQIAPIVNGLTDFRINEWDGEMRIKGVRAVTPIEPIGADGLGAVGDVRAE